MGLKNIAKLKKETDRLTSTGGGGGSFMDNFVKMPETEGILTLRILPPLSGEIDDLFQWTRLHNINGQRLHCPNELDPTTGYWEGVCPICKYVRYLWKLSDGKTRDEAEALQAEAREIGANERYYYVVVVKTQAGIYKGNKPNQLNTPLIWSVGKQLHAKVLVALTGSEKDQEPPLGDITAFDGEGRDFKLIKKSKAGNNGKSYPNYDQSKFLDPSVAGTHEQWEEWLTKMPSLKTLRVVPTIDELDLEIAYHRGALDDPRKQGFDVAKYDGWGKGGGGGGNAKAPQPAPKGDDDYVPPSAAPRTSGLGGRKPAAAVTPKGDDPFEDGTGGATTGVVSEDFLDALGPPPQ